MMNWNVVFLPFLCCCLCVAEISTIRIIRPQPYSFSGSLVHFQALVNDYSTSQTTLLSLERLSVEIFCNGEFIVHAPLMKVLYEVHFMLEGFRENNSIQILLLTDNVLTDVAVTHVIRKRLSIVPFGQWNVSLSHDNAGETATAAVFPWSQDKLKIILVFGLSHEEIQYFAELNPTMFYVFTERCTTNIHRVDDTYNSSSMYTLDVCDLVGARLCKCFATSTLGPSTEGTVGMDASYWARQLSRLVAFVDHSFISMRGWEESTSSSVVDAFVTNVIRLTRGSVWVFRGDRSVSLGVGLDSKGEGADDTLKNTCNRPPSNVVLCMTLGNDSNRLTLDPANINGSMANPTAVLDVWVAVYYAVDVSNDDVYFNSVTGQSIDGNGSKTSLLDLHGGDTKVGNSKMKGISSFPQSSVQYMHLQLGRSYMHFKNVCLLPDGKTVLLFNYQFQESQGQHQPQSLVDERLLAQSEDFGFLYSGLRFHQVNQMNSNVDVGEQAEGTAGGRGASSSAQDIAFAQDLWTSKPLWRGVSAMNVAVQSGHMIHEIEGFLQLLVYWWDQAEGTTAEGEGYPSHMKSLFPRISRLLLPTLTKHLAGDWLLSFMALLNSFTQPKDGPSIRGVYLQEHIFPSQELRVDIDDVGAAGSCFEDLIVLGRTNTRKMFFPSKDLAVLFKAFVYEQLKLTSLQRRHKQKASGHRMKSTGYASALTPSHTVVHHTLESSKLLKVTFAIRAGSSRKVLNLPALLSYCSSMNNGGASIDLNWLENHVVMFELLGFKEQVSLMHETDILVTVHGGGVLNSIFMEASSVVLQILNGPFYDDFFVSTLEHNLIKLLDVEVANDSQCSDCPDLPADCFNQTKWQQRESSFSFYRCFRLRECSVMVDMSNFKVAWAKAKAHIFNHKYPG